MQPGDKVRLIASPSRVGRLTAEQDGPPHRLRYLVDFGAGAEEFHPLGSLESLKLVAPRPYQSIKDGRYEGVYDLRGAITFYRLSGKLANLIYSLNTTNTEFYSYQFKPVLHFLDSPCNGILIADEVGLGKTIEAGLIWTELRARLDAKHLLIICPAMLCEKWKDELANRFGVNAEIVDSGGLLKRLEGVRSRPQDSFACIASIQGIRPPKNFENQDSESNTAKLARYLSDADVEDPLLDLVVIDEAHYLRNAVTQTHKLGKLLRPVTQNLVLLSATPIQMRNSDLFNLLNLIDEDAFPYEYSFIQSLQSNAPILKLRDEVLSREISQVEFVEALSDALSARYFEDNEQIQYLKDNPPTDEYLSTHQGRSEIADKLDRINPLTKVVTRTLKRDVQEMRVVREPLAIKARMSEAEREFYQLVTEAVRAYCENQNMASGFMLTIPQRQMSSSMAAACRGWISKVDQDNDDEIEEIVFEAFGEIEQDVPSKVKLGPLLRQLVSITKRIGNFSLLSLNDSKYNKLIENIKKYWVENPGNKIVLFSFYRHTLYYLQERLSNDHIQSVILHGGMDKQQALNRFAGHDGPDILISSEVASEGVDLQFSSLVINYDLPWNPMKIEQRIGRIDRIGQKSDKIFIWNMMYEDTIDDRVYERLLQRLNIFKQALGSMENILGEEIRELGYELLSHKLTPQQEADRLDLASVAIETNNRQQQKLEEEATQLIAHGDFIQNKVKAAKELGRFIMGEDLLVYVRDFLCKKFEGTSFISLSENKLQVIPKLSVKARVEFSTFLERQGMLGRTKLASSQPSNLLFENQLGKSSFDIERVTQDHPLIRFVTEQMNLSEKSFYPASAIQMNAIAHSDAIPGTYVYVIKRWSVSGSRDIERLEYSMINFDNKLEISSDKAESLMNAAALVGKDWHSAMNEVDNQAVAELFDDCQYQLDLRFKDFKESQQREDRDRINMMVNTLQKHLERQSQQIMDRINYYTNFGTEKQRRLIPAENGKLKKLKARLNGRMDELRLREKIESQSNFVSGGIVKIV